MYKYRVYISKSVYVYVHLSGLINLNVNTLLAHVPSPYLLTSTLVGLFSAARTPQLCDQRPSGAPQSQNETELTNSNVNTRLDYVQSLYY